MPNYRRPWIPGATYFITIVAYRRRRLFFHGQTVSLWRQALAQTRREKPFEIHTGVVLPDHVHMVIGLPDGDADISSRIGRAKALLSKALNANRSGSNASRYRHREADIWQRRFFDHVIRDETDYAQRVDYIHYNPVKHGYVQCPKEWPHSSFHRWVEKGIYPRDWGCPHHGPVPEFDAIDGQTGE